MSDNGVLVLTGPPCAGKSAIGRTLASSPPSGTDRRSIYLEVDSLFSLLLPGSDRNRDDRMLGYDAAHLLARMLLDRGQMPVLECTYSRRQQRASLLQVIADTPETPLWVVEVAVSPDDAVLRFQRRPQATDLHERLVHERARTFPTPTRPCGLHPHLLRRTTWRSRSRPGCGCSPNPSTGPDGPRRGRPGTEHGRARSSHSATWHGRARFAIA